MIMEAKRLSRAQESRLAAATAKRLGLDAEHGSGRVDIGAISDG
jgi:hypothetical protein